MSTTQPEVKTGNLFVRIVRDSFVLTIVLEVAFGVLTAIAGAVVGDVTPFVIFLVAAAIVQILERIRGFRSRTKAKQLGNRISQLTGEVVEERINAAGAKAETQELVAAIRRSAQRALQQIADKHAMNDCDRITLYQVVGDDDLAIVARYSLDTDYRKISPEKFATRYPPSHGLIGRALQSGEVKRATRRTPFTADEKAYRDWLYKNGLLVQAGEEPKMKSIKYVAIPVWNSVAKEHLVGVVCFETTRFQCPPVTAVPAVLRDEKDATIGMIRELLVLAASATRRDLNEGGDA